MRDKYVRSKKSFKESNKSGTSAKIVKKTKEKLDDLAFMQWLDDYIRPRASKHNDTSDQPLGNEASLDISESFAETQHGSDSEDSNETCSKTLQSSKRKVAQSEPKESTKKKKKRQISKRRKWIYYAR